MKDYLRQRTRDQGKKKKKILLIFCCNIKGYENKKENIIKFNQSSVFEV